MARVAFLVPLAVFIVFASTILLADAYDDRVLLTDVTALRFYPGKKTKAHRSRPIPQMKCISGPCKSVDISAIQCKNVGSAGDGDVQWECNAELPEGVSFSSINVNCEGYDNKEDEYVLKGSCGLEYGLKGKPVESSRKRRSQSYYEDTEPYFFDFGGGKGGFFGWLFSPIWWVISLPFRIFHFVVSFFSWGALLVAGAIGYFAFARNGYY